MPKAVTSSFSTTPGSSVCILRSITLFSRVTSPYEPHAARPKPALGANSVEPGPPPITSVQSEAGFNVATKKEAPADPHSHDPLCRPHFRGCSVSTVQLRPDAGVVVFFRANAAGHLQATTLFSCPPVPPTEATASSVKTKTPSRLTFIRRMRPLLGLPLGAFFLFTFRFDAGRSLIVVNRSSTAVTE